MMINKLLIATHNSAKIEELTMTLRNAMRNVTLYSLKDVGIDEEPEETGKTYKDNALLKAKYYAERANIPAIADDGGFSIDALNGEPGVISNRWLGRKATDKELIDYTFERMKHVPIEKRTAALVICLCFYDPETGTALFQQEEIRGYVPFEPYNKPKEGFPYRTIFKIADYDKYYDELTEEEHEEVNHRRIAVNKLVQTINNSVQ